MNMHRYIADAISTVQDQQFSVINIQRTAPIYHQDYVGCQDRCTTSNLQLMWHHGIIQTGHDTFRAFSSEGRHTCSERHYNGFRQFILLNNIDHIKLKIVSFIEVREQVSPNVILILDLHYASRPLNMSGFSIRIYIRSLVIFNLESFLSYYLV